MHLRHPSVLAAYAGRNTGMFCKTVADFGVGMVTVGGISVDAATQEQSVAMARRGRSEFLFDDCGAFIRDALDVLDGCGARVAVNIRSATLEGYVEAAERVDECGGIVEIDAHCRQPEMLQVGAGQALLSRPERIREILEALSVERSIPTILKVRGNVLPGTVLADIAEDCCTALHVDAMLEGRDTFDPSVFLDIPDGMFLIGNNSVRDVASAEAILEYCDAFSFARLANDLAATRDLVSHF